MKTLLLTILAASMGIVTGNLLSENNVSYPEKDASIIVECDKSLNGLSKENIFKSQDIVLSSIKENVTKNVKMGTRFSVLNNAFVLEVNSNDIEAIKNVPGVKSVSINQIHIASVQNDDDTIRITSRGSQTGVDKNISAETMQMPDDTNEGEGTVIAVLDNEFYLKGATKTEDAWCHETFSPLDDDVAVRFTFDNLTSTLKSQTHAKRKSSRYLAGEEGSLYFNNKVPFYYDYGGSLESYSDSYLHPDFDVVTKSSYHGSHVASIASGNAPTYKGIAPKAQLLLMKVFCDFDVTETAKNMGLQSYSGGSDEAILMALEDAIALGADTVNMSLGTNLNDFMQNSITIRTVDKLQKYGILSAISAGNDGKSSYNFAGSYANWSEDMVETGTLSGYCNEENPMIVASGQPDEIYYESALQIGNKIIPYDDQVINREGLPADFDTEHKMEELTKEHTGKFQYVYTGKFGLSTDYNKLDADGKVVIVNRGSNSFEDKYNQAVAANAIALIIIDNDPTASTFNFRCSFGDTEPDIPVALLLFKDKPYFDQNPTGEFDLINKKANANETPRTISTYSSDGGTFDLNLKPDITTPGESIRGAVPPQKKEDKAETPLSTYEYLSGTSMAAPNYAGSQALMLSTVTKDLYRSLNDVKTELTEEELKKIADYKNTIDMRMMSTAVPMIDSKVCPEGDGDKYNQTSPRLQGPGMVRLDRALSTETYLEGYDLNGNRIGKSKIALRNNPEIAKGNINISFAGHNESEKTLTYSAKMTVMRPATIMNNGIFTGIYNVRGTVEEEKSIPGLSYFDGNYQKTDTSSVKVNDAINVTRKIEYWPNENAWNADHQDEELPMEATSHNESVVMEIGKYYCSSTSPITWSSLPAEEYLSVQDYLIDEVTLPDVTLNPGENKITFDTYSLSKEVKEEILEHFPFGTYIEGFVSLTAKGEGVDMSIPYMGFYSGNDMDESRSFSDAPVTEPFDFEKDNSTVYPSDLVNDIAKTLLAKDNSDMGSMWVVGYAKSVDSINVSNITKNDSSFDRISGFRNVGTDPRKGTYLSNPGENIYVGNPLETNTMIIQQFILRSAKDNYFTIKNKETGEEVYRSALEDMLYGQYEQNYPLFKSHVDSGFLGGGYVCHRAYAIIPLYDHDTNEPFSDGVYELEFNYLLAATNEWVKSTYTFNIDSTAPEITGISSYNKDGEDRVRIDIKETRISYGVIGYNLVDVEYDEAKGNYFIDISKEELDQSIQEINEGTLANRMFVQLVDMAGGKTGALVHINKSDFTDYDLVQSSGLTVTNDFKYDGKTLTFVKIDEEGREQPFELTADYKFNKAINNGSDSESKGCGGNMIYCSITLTTLSLAGIALLMLRKKKKNLIKGE